MKRISLFVHFSFLSAASAVLICVSCAAPTPAKPSVIEKEAGILQEDTRLRDVKGKVVDLEDDLHLTDYHRNAFVPTGSNRVFILLGSNALEQLEEEAKGGKEVTVSGIVTQYRDRDYLLLPRVMGAVGEESGLLPEESRLIDRVGRLFTSKDLGMEGPERLVFVLKAGGEKFTVLENLNLERLETAGRHGEREVTISGTITVYRGKNYLLLTRVAKEVF